MYILIYNEKSTNKRINKEVTEERMKEQTGFAIFQSSSLSGNFFHKLFQLIQSDYCRIIERIGIMQVYIPNTHLYIFAYIRNVSRTKICLFR